jgi:hypothetical protein
MTGTTVRSKLRLAKAAAINSSEEIIANDGFSVSVAPKEVRLNPLGDLIDDTTFAILQQHKLIDQKSLRDYQIRKSYREMREKCRPETPSTSSSRCIHTFNSIRSVKSSIKCPRRLPELRDCSHLLPRSIATLKFALP